MTILFAGGEDTSFTMTSAAFSGGIRRTSFARGAIFMSGDPTTDPPNSRATPPTAFTPSSDLWFHAQIASETNLMSNGAQLLRFTDGSTARIVVRCTATAGTFKISTRNAAGTFVDLVTASAITLSNSVTHVLDLHVVYAVSGSVTLYWDGVSIATYSGDVTTNGATTLDNFQISNNHNTNSTYWSEIIIADEDTRSMSLWTLVPVAAGNTQNWTPNTVGNINELVSDDAAFVSTTANNDLSEWTTSITPPSGVWNVRAIVQEARVEVNLTSPQHFDWAVRVSATDNLAGTSNAPIVGSFSNFHYQWNQNPHTSADWVIGEITTGFNLGIKSLA